MFINLSYSNIYTILHLIKKMLQFDCIFSVLQRENTAKPNLSKGCTCILPAKTSVRFHGVGPKIRDFPM